MRGLGWCAWVVLVPLLATAGELARAQAVPPPGSAPAAAAPVVEVVVVGGGREASALLDTVRDLLGRAGLVLEAHAVATPGEGAAVPRGAGMARVVVDLRMPAEAVLSIEGRRQGAKERVLRRDPSPSIAREELAQAIQSGVEAQLFMDPEGHAIPPPPAASGSSEPPPPPAPPPSAAPPPPGLQPDTPSPTTAVPAEVPVALPPPAPREAPTSSRPALPVGVDVSTLAGGGWFASGSGPVAALGGDVTVAGRRGWRPSLSLSARAVLPFGGSADEVTGHASAFAIRALAGVEVVHSSWFALAGGGGAGADLLWASPSSAVLPPSVLGPDSTRADPILTAFAAAHLKLVPSVVLTVMALADVDLAPSRYVVKEGPTDEPVLSPWRVRPTLLAGFSFTALGQPEFVRGGSP